MDTKTKLDSFTTAYIEAAFWSCTTDDDNPMDREYGISDLAPEALERIIADCEKFQEQFSVQIYEQDSYRYHADYGTPEMAGHDFWLTRNGHGAGFWDGDWKESAATELDNGSKAFGECGLYVGDDGKVYLS